MNQNSLNPQSESRVLFIDMNSFFASCEQQVNYWLRDRPVGVCVYTGKFSCIIAPSIEAKKKGIKTGMRLNEAILLCPDLVPLETNPARYRDFHTKIIKVLKKYSNDVIPKSIDEAIVNLHNYKLVHDDMISVAKKIKQDIHTEVGDWLKCSIGIAPNAFLAKLASDVQKPDGLTIIDHDNIDNVLSKMRLKDLPGIAGNMAERLQAAGIQTPVQLRHTSPERLRIICKGVVGDYWHSRLNFAEVDMKDNDYKSMQAMRHLSAVQRKTLYTIEEILLSLCLTLEKRMVDTTVFCQTIGFHARYENNFSYSDTIHISVPIQDGSELLNALKKRMKHYEDANKCEPVLNTNIISLSVYVGDFVDENMVQYGMFEDNSKRDKLRKTVYALKGKFGLDKLIRAAEIKEEEYVKDVIGFGSIKDLHDTM
ncbi:MAG: nucleotidyltransferase/DNA polymerase involved in repair [Bacteroidetes bacterium]|nr:nucleotidyltransferase/DNA polymerase involved in repair [Bacteroidota bacterium]